MARVERTHSLQALLYVYDCKPSRELPACAWKMVLIAHPVQVLKMRKTALEYFEQALDIAESLKPMDVSGEQ